MRVEEYKNLTDEQLTQKANECLTALDNQYYPQLHAAKLLEAQLYMNEINRRNDEKIATRDGQMAERSHKMEIWVIILIGVEILIGVGGIAIGCREGNQQVAVLEQMKKSTAATAATLQTQGNIFTTIDGNTAKTVEAVGKLQQSQDNLLQAQQSSLVTLKNTLKSIGEMNFALQRQLAMAFDVAVIVTTDDVTKRIGVLNQTKTVIIIYGMKYDGEPPVKFPDQKYLPSGDRYDFFEDGVYQNAALIVPKRLEKQVPLEVYVQGADGKRYIVYSYLLMKWENETMKIYPTVNSIKQEQWPPGIE